MRIYLILRHRAAPLAIAGLLALSRGAHAQPAPAEGGTFTLSAALEEANRNAFSNRRANANTDAERARARQPLKGLLPSARVETGAIRTTDPIAAFGTTLRQRTVTQDAFAPARLNNPAPITNVQGGLVLEVPLLNVDAFAGLRAARAGADAASASADWAAINTRASVVRAYYAAVLAGESASTLESAADATNAALRQVQSMVRQGLVTKADALQAEVRAANVEADLLAARNAAVTAAQQLEVVLGRTTHTPLRLPTELPDAAALRALAAHDTLIAENASADRSTRADIRAASAALSAATTDRSRATSTLLPRLNSFARFDWNDPTVPFGGRRNWTVGVMASWSLFNGGSEWADIAGATARVAGAKASRDAALAESRLEADATLRGIVLALQRLDLADRAADASREAHRLVEKRYAGGLATIADLLAAESSATSAALGQAAARFAVIDAITAHRRATGADPADLADLDKKS